ncbi:hypothetical protein AKO1_007472, partial [Acrasis kona]
MPPGETDYDKMEQAVVEGTVKRLEEAIEHNVCLKKLNKKQPTRFKLSEIKYPYMPPGEIDYDKMEQAMVEGTVKRFEEAIEQSQDEEERKDLKKWLARYLSQDAHKDNVCLKKLNKKQPTRFKLSEIKYPYMPPGEIDYDKMEQAMVEGTVKRFEEAIEQSQDEEERKDLKKWLAHYLSHPYVPPGETDYDKVKQAVVEGTVKRSKEAIEQSQDEEE